MSGREYTREELREMTLEAYRAAINAALARGDGETARRLMEGREYLMAKWEAEDARGQAA